MNLKQVNLGHSQEPLYIPYPENFSGAKSGADGESVFSLTTTPRMLTEDEVKVAKDFIARLPYKQSLEMTGCVLVNTKDFPVLDTQLDRLEAEYGIKSTAYAGKLRRTPRQRQLILAERLAIKGVDYKKKFKRLLPEQKPTNDTPPQDSDAASEKNNKQEEKKEAEPARKSGRRTKTQSNNKSRVSEETSEDA